MNKHHKINVIDLDEDTGGDSEKSYNSDRQFNDIVDDFIRQSDEHTVKERARRQTLQIHSRYQVVPITPSFNNSKSIELADFEEKNEAINKFKNVKNKHKSMLMKVNEEQID